MKKLLIGIFTLLCLSKTAQVASAQTASQPLISFEQVEQLPKDTAVKIPVLINTQGKSLDSLQLKINIEGQVENLGLQVGTTVPVQEITQEITENGVFVSLTSVDLGKSWSTQEDTELLSIAFTHSGDGMVTLSFDKKETLAAASDSENNVLSVGQDLTVKIGEVMPVEEEQVEVTPSAQQEEVLPTEETSPNQLNNNLLIALIAASFVAAAITLVYILKGGSKNKADQQPKSPLS